MQTDVSKYGEIGEDHAAYPTCTGEYAIVAQTQDNQPVAYCFRIDEAK